MKIRYQARNKLTASVKSIQRRDVMSLVKLEVTEPAEMGWVITSESVDCLLFR